MPEVFCNTSPLQYLHQTRLLRILPALCGRVLVPPAVVSELREGLRQGFDLPDPAAQEWIQVRGPSSALVLPLVMDLGPGETEVLALALEAPGSTALLDDGLARRIAFSLGIKVRGTLGLLLDAKKRRLIEAVGPVLRDLDRLRFRLSPTTRNAVLLLAGEAPPVGTTED